jgi:hypothetical protein
MIILTQSLIYKLILYLNFGMYICSYVLPYLTCIIIQKRNSLSYTRKTTQVITNLHIACVPVHYTVCSGLEHRLTCTRLIAVLFQQLVNRMCSQLVDKQCEQNLLTACWQTCYKMVIFACKFNKPAADLYQLICCSNNFSTGCVRTACSQLVRKLSTACW